MQKLHNIFKNELPTIDVMFLVFQALGKQPGIHCPKLHCRVINPQTIIGVKHYITSDVMN